MGRRKPVWNKATWKDIQNYSNMLDGKLMRMEKTDRMTCNNPKCSDEVHMKEIDNNVLDVLMRVVESNY